jgi:hypothetical protein
MSEGPNRDRASQPGEPEPQGGGQDEGDGPEPIREVDPEQIEEQGKQCPGGDEGPPKPVIRSATDPCLFHHPTPESLRCDDRSRLYFTGDNHPVVKSNL